MFPYDTREDPALPIVQLRITDNSSRLRIPAFDAVVDSGADRSCLPGSILKGLGPLSYGKVLVRYVGDAMRENRDTVRILDATVDLLDRRGALRLTKKCENLVLIVHEEGILGRDILNRLLCELDGPRLRCRIR